MDRYVEYFNVQDGGGGGYSGGGTYSGGVGRIYIGAPHQRGHGGIGSFLAGIFRRVLPLVKRGAKVVGKEAMRAGMNIMSDVATRNTPLEESFRNRVRESGEALKRRAEEKLDRLMEGSGYKVPRYGEALQLHTPGISGLVRQTKIKRKKRKGASKQSKKKKKTVRKKLRGVKVKGKKKKIRKQTKRTTRDIFDL